MDASSPATAYRQRPFPPAPRLVSALGVGVSESTDACESTGDRASERAAQGGLSCLERVKGIFRTSNPLTNNQFLPFALRARAVRLVQHDPAQQDGHEATRQKDGGDARCIAVHRPRHPACGPFPCAVEALRRTSRRLVGERPGAGMRPRCSSQPHPVLQQHALQLPGWRFP